MKHLTELAPSQWLKLHRTQGSDYYQEMSRKKRQPMTEKCPGSCLGVLEME